MPRQIPKAGDLFAVPLEDHTWCLGQVLDTKPVLNHSFTCAFFDVRGEKETLWSAPTGPTPDLLISRQFATREQFSQGNWPRIGAATINLRRKDLPYVGFWWFRRPIVKRVIGSANIESFLSAYYGLRSWTEMNNPNYYDYLLTDDRRRQRAPTTPVAMEAEARPAARCFMTDEEAARIESEFALSIPAAWRSRMTDADWGERFSETGLLTSYEAMRRENRRYRDLEAVRTYWRPEWLAIHSDGCGNVYFLDTRKPAAVFEFDHEQAFPGYDPLERAVFPSIEAFLSDVEEFEIDE